MSKLVIAEKSSVSKTIAAVLGATGREDGCFIGNGYIVSWCFGHLAELASADVYDEKYGKWCYEDLPIVPQPWRYAISQDKQKQFDLLRELLRSDEVSEVINACDAGREGELIFRTVYALSGCTKPMKRLWISSMEDEAIREGFENLRPGSEYDTLYEAALCRSRADWLVGINATRLFSVLYHRTLNVGRVVSPTLALIVQREAEIQTFTSTPFYTVNLSANGFEAASERYAEKAQAEGQHCIYPWAGGTGKSENADAGTRRKIAPERCAASMENAVQGAWGLCHQQAKLGISAPRKSPAKRRL